MGNFAVSWRFRVIIDGKQYGFSKVSNLAAEMEYESVAEGGRNDKPLLFRKGPAKHSTLTLERGIHLDSNGNGSSGFAVGTAIREFLLFVDEDQKTKKAARVFSFDEGVVTKSETGSLDAVDNHVLIETMEIAHSGLLVVRR